MVSARRRRVPHQADCVKATDISKPGAFAVQSCLCPDPRDGAVVPQWQRECKPYIRNGFRVAFTNWQCFLSIFPVFGLSKFHNEVINIWTHLLPGVGALWLSLKQVLNLTDGTDVAMLLFFAAASFMFLASATYHTFNDLSQHATRLLLKVDLFGISTMIAGSYVPAVYMGFACFPTWRCVWLTMAGLLLVLGALVAFDFVKDDHKTPCLCLLVGVGVIPAAHWAVIMPSDEFVMLWRGVVSMFLFYGSGAAIFVSRWPERVLPGKTCMLGCSHQWWHVFVLLAAMVWWWNCETQRSHFREKQLLTTVHLCDGR